VASPGYILPARETQKEILTMRNLLITFVAVGLTVSLCACTASSQDKSVKTNYRSQWTTVNADVKKTTAAAEEVLKELSLLDVKSAATNVDGSATAKKANGAKIRVSVTWVTDSRSKMSVTVGSGDPSLGTDIVRKIKQKVEPASTTRP
jgi:hypothetical protein